MRHANGRAFFLAPQQSAPTPAQPATMASSPWLRHAFAGHAAAEAVAGLSLMALPGLPLPHASPRELMLAQAWGVSLLGFAVPFAAAAAALACRLRALPTVASLGLCAGATAYHALISFLLFRAVAAALLVPAPIWLACACVHLAAATAFSALTAQHRPLLVLSNLMRSDAKDRGSAGSPPSAPAPKSPAGTSPRRRGVASSVSSSSGGASTSAPGGAADRAGARGQATADIAADCTADNATGTDSAAPASHVPAHVAIIMDGNRRFARRAGVSFVQAYERGGEVLRDAARWCRAHGTRFLTVFAFSCENWKRSPAEVDGLMRFFHRVLSDMLARHAAALRAQQEGRALAPEEEEARGARVLFIGRRDRLPPAVQRLMAGLEAATAEGYDFTLTIAVDYSGQWDMAQACQRVVAAADRLRLPSVPSQDCLGGAGSKAGEAPAAAASDAPAAARRAGARNEEAEAPVDADADTWVAGASNGKVDPYQAWVDAVEQHLSTAALPPVDLLLRTGGDTRVSNFLLWQIAYAEIAVVPEKWPELCEQRVAEVVQQFGARERRFGK